MKREDKDLKIFILALAIVISLISIKFASLNKQAFSHFLIFGALLLFAIGILRPKILKSVYRCWMVLAKAINTLITAVVLIPVFYLVVTPIGLVLRLFGKDLLGLKINDSDSYWLKKEDSISKESYLKQY